LSGHLPLLADGLELQVIEIGILGVFHCCSMIYYGIYKMLRMRRY
jgi:hypothetical protein